MVFQRVVREGPSKEMTSESKPPWSISHLILIIFFHFIFLFSLLYPGLAHWERSWYDGKNTNTNCSVMSGKQWSLCTTVSPSNKWAVRRIKKDKVPRVPRTGSEAELSTSPFFVVLVDNPFFKIREQEGFLEIIYFIFNLPMGKIKSLRNEAKNSWLVIPSQRSSTVSSFCYASVFEIFIFTCENFFQMKS